MKKPFSIMLIATIFFQACAGTMKPHQPIDRNILAGLESKAREINCYAYDLTVNGIRVKRMSYQFEKNGQPFYRFREDLMRSGKAYVYIYNADGRHDYHYYPDEKKAFRCPTSGAWNETNYKDAQKWHFGYQEGRIVGEDIVLGKSCYLILLRNNVYAIWKEKGVKLAKKNNLNDKQYAIFHQNMAFDISDDVFAIPSDVRVVDQKECGF